MKNLKVLITLMVIAGLYACSPEKTENTNGDEVVGKTINVETVMVEPTSFERKLRVIGMVETQNDIMISAEVSGRIIEHVVSEGDKVQAGQAILRIDDSKLKQEQSRLEAITAQARENYERLKRVYEEDGIGSEMEFLNAKYNFEQNQSALASINVDVENTEITAPFDGRVEDFLLEEGEMASPGMQLVRLIGSDTYVVSAGVPARYANVVDNGDKVDIWFDTQTADTLKGIITYVGNTINTQNRTFRVEVLLPSQSTMYKVDMIANLRLNTLSEDNVLVVSEEFIYKEENEFIIYVKSVDENGDPVAERRQVILGPSYRSDVIIREGLQAGEELITIGSAFLNNGMRLNIVSDAENDLAAQ